MYVVKIQYIQVYYMFTGPSKSRKDEKKKKRPNSHSNSDKKKKLKIETSSEAAPRPRPGSMNERDKEALECWKKFQKASHMTKNGVEEDVDKMMMFQHQQLMGRQIEEQNLVIANQQKIIQEQLQYIGVLREQKQALLRECQQAGLNISDIPSLQTPSKPSLPASQHFSLPPSHMTYPTPSQLAPPAHSQPQPSSPSQTATMGKPLPSYPHPSFPLPPSSQQQQTPHHRLTPAVLAQQQPPPLPTHCVGPPPCSYPGLSSNQLTATSTAQPPSLPPHLSLYMTPDSCSRLPSLPENLTFSPLTSSEFREIEHKDQPPGYTALLMRSYDEELNSILDIAGLPTGRGSGYGVGVADDELPALDLRCACACYVSIYVFRWPQEVLSYFRIFYICYSHLDLCLSLSNLGTSAPAGPPSASLLQEWLDINQLDPEDMDVLQKELEAGAPDSIIGALDDL